MSLNSWFNYRVLFLNISPPMKSLSPGAQEMLEEVMRSPVLLKESDTNTQKERPVTEVVDTVLSCVRMVKAASSFSSSRHCQQARASWRSLIAALGIAILEDVLILYALDHFIISTSHWCV